jgi:hypothetical protein
LPIVQKTYTLNVMATTRRWGPGTSALVRALVAARHPVTQTELAALVGVSQPRVSQVLAQLAAKSAVTSKADGYLGRLPKLLDLYVANHRPALVDTEVPWYGLQPMRQQVERICERATASSTRIAVSADVAPDLLAPWRHPTLTVVYADAALDLADAGLVRAEGRVDATVLVRHTSDTTLLSPFEPWPRHVENMPLADPVEQMWDLRDLGGEDRGQAADRLAERILDRSLQAAT